ncbi:MAG: hypothetical protein IAB80_03060 [Bacteroidetes bacterium]|uniref:Lipoprotein n=1 Tax=Candidatus Cryptobacteroides excrementipullorum TaxID=2840761 RepID=A0A9D9NLH6_9BACT|nr:hypothetical protein [Candidatus Cryptobacteroides excrementipullorum]
MKKYIFMYIPLLLVCSCQVNNTERFYCSQFMSYLQEMKIDVSDTEYYYAVHMQGCNTCISSSIAFINDLPSTIKERMLVLFVGDYIGNDIECFKSIEILKNEISYIEDSHQKIFNYQTGFAYPLFIKIKNGKCKMYEEMVNEKYSDTKLLQKLE